jgi:hypothetical protein
VPLPKENLEHPCFPQPDDPKVLVWRYIDFPKLVSGLTENALVLSRVDTLDDKREGRHGKHLRTVVVQSALLQTIAQGNPSGSIDRHLADQLGDHVLLNEEMIRAVSFVSCWCKGGERESEAMWRIYAGRGASVALVLPYERLRDSLNQPDLYIGTVTYFDFNKGVVPVGNAFRPMMWKSHEYTYEDEVRIVKLDLALWESGGAAGGTRPRPDRPSVIKVPWVMSDHIERIVISPYAKRWQADAIRAVLARVSPGLERRICDSEMM